MSAATRASSDRWTKFYPSVSPKVYLALWAVAAVLAIVGGISFWRNGRRCVDGRHRIDIEWAILILSSVGIVALLRRWSSARLRAPWM